MAVLLRLEANMPGSVDSTLREAIRVARVVGVTVAIVVNEVEVIVDPLDRGEVLIKNFHRAVELGAKVCIGGD